MGTRIDSRVAERLKMSNVGVEAAQCPFFLPQTKRCQ